jgi:chromosome partitioning protein
MVIAVSHQKGGVGKSTIAFNLAVELSKRYPVEMIDLDVQETVSAYNRIRKMMGQKGLLIHSFKNDKEMVDFVNNSDEKKVIIIDSGGFDSSMNRLSIALADFLITPVSSEFTEILGLEKYKQILDQVSSKVGETIVTNVVLNKISPQLKNFDEIIEFINSSEHFELLNTKLRRRVDFSNSVAHGFSVKELDEYSESSKELQLLLEEIIKKAELDG